MLVLSQRVSLIVAHISMSSTQQAEAGPSGDGSGQSSLPAEVLAGILSSVRDVVREEIRAVTSEREGASARPPDTETAEGTASAPPGPSSGASGKCRRVDLG